MDPVTVRRLDLTDADAWAALRREALESHPLAFGASIPDDPGVLTEFIRTRLASSEESAIFGAFAETSLVGIVGVIRQVGRKERHKSTIWGMYVTAGRRRMGAGGALLRAAIAQARTWVEIEQVHLAVSEVAIDARKLYERSGFRPWGQEPRALSIDGRSADETHMVLPLREIGVAGEVVGLDHIQLAMPVEQEAAARAFYGAVLGLYEEPKPRHLAARGGVWFRRGGLRLHLGVDPDFRAAAKAHPALRVRGLQEIAERCAAAGFPPVTDQPLEGFNRLYVSDPFGNRIELLEPVAV